MKCARVLKSKTAECSFLLLGCLCPEVYLSQPCLSCSLWWHLSLHFMHSFLLIGQLCSVYYVLGFPGGSDSQESAYNLGDLGSSPGLGRSPGEGKGYTLVFWPGEFHGLYSPRNRKESDMTKQPSLHFTRLSGKL